MRKSFVRLTVALLATAFAMPQVWAQQSTARAPTRSLEDAIETSTDAVLMPSSVPGTLTFRGCREPCRLRSLEVTAESKFFVGATQVTLADFSAYVQRTGEQFLMVFRKPDGTAVTRMLVYGTM
jgi:hypothetical protein